MQTKRSPVVPLRHTAPQIQRLSFPSGRRIVAISDIHGNLPYLKGLLERIAFSQQDILVLDGDFLEKGKYSLDTLRYLVSLSKDHDIYPVSGNCDWWLPLMYEDEIREGNLWYINNKPFCLAKQMCEELGIPISMEMDYFAMRKQIVSHFSEEFSFLRAMPEILETDYYTFVHGGLPEGTPDSWSAWNCMKYDHFMSTDRCFDKWIIVGHWPVMLYHENIVDANPVFSYSKKIVSIDGGCVLKDDGQLNALIIPEYGSTDFSFVSYDPFPTAVVQDAQTASVSSYYIRWGDSQVQVLERGEEFSRIRHIRTGYEMDVLTKYLLGPDPVCNVNDCTDYILPLAPGDKVSIIEESSRGYFVKHNGISGWYFGRLLPESNMKG